MRDYQQKSMKEFVLPQTVYRQALWAVKDLSRLHDKLSEAKEIAYEPAAQRNDIQPVAKASGKVCDKTAIHAVDMVYLSQRIEAIESAFALIPKKYREGIRLKLVYNMPYCDDFHPNTWKKWQQVYIYYVAINLHLL